ncbi:MAG: exonuclease domain-containing protein [bacterium]
MSTYLFYDIETTGLNYAFDQVLQFAAIRTDRTFAELERHEIYLRLRPDVVPSPAAMIAHCLSIDTLMARGVCEYEAIKQIHALLNEPGTISLGYNTLGFDDEFLRFSFHRNLLPPYTHQYARDCGRMDLLPMAIMYWLFRKETLNWPEIDERVSLKLEHLKEANQLSSGSAHDALVDVQASVELARRMAQDEKMWDYLADYFKKGSDRYRLQKLPPLSEKLHPGTQFGLLINIDYGAERNYLVPVLFLGYSEPYRNQSLWLRLDRPEIQETTLQNIAAKTWLIRKKHGEPGIVLPPFERFLARLDGERMALLEQNKQWLQSHPELLQAIAQFYRQFKYPEIADVDVDAALYQMDFLTDAEQRQCARFHTLGRAGQIQEAEKFERPELRELARRLFFRNDASDLPQAWKKKLDAFLYKVNPVFKEEALMDYRGRKRRVPLEVAAEIRRLQSQNNLSPRQEAVLQELQSYLQERFGVRAQEG